jgi:hypothetical protein
MDVIMALSLLIRDMAAMVDGCAGAGALRTDLLVLVPRVPLYTQSWGPARLWPPVGRGEGATRVEFVIRPSKNGSQSLVGLVG